MSKPNLATKNCRNCNKEFKPWKRSSKFCSRKCYHSYGHRSKRKKTSWWVNTKGYVEGRVWVHSNKQIRVLRHRWKMENHLGRKLKDNEDVHHLDGNKLNNALGNLLVISHAEHTKLTNKNRDYKSGYKMNLSDAERKRRSDALKE